MKNNGTKHITNQSATTPNNRRLTACVKWLVAVAVGLAAQAGAATIRVPQDQPTITAGISAASAGDTVSVSPGTYNEYNIPIAKPVTVTSVGSATNTIVDMQHNGRGFMITNASQTAINILGLTIQNAAIPYYSGGGAVLIVSGKCRISGCIIQGNSGPADYSGGPIANWGTNIDDVLVDNCVVRNNFAANGCAISGCAVFGCLIYNNSAGNNPMALSGCHATNCTVYNNTGGYLGNPWTAGGMSGGTAVNCIFWGNSGHNGQQVDPGSSATVTYSIVQGGFAGTGNLSSDPLFVNAAAGNFHLQTNSPAKHAGDPATFNVDGSRADMGAFGGGFSPAITPLNLPQITLFAAACDPLSNTYVVGTFTNTVVIGGQSYSPYAGTTYLLAQYRPNGTVGWAIRFGTSSSATPQFNLCTTLTVTSNAVYVTGATGGSIHIVDTASNAVDTAFNSGNKAGGSDGYLFRFSLTGVAVWQASITGSSAGDSGNGVTVDAAGNVYWVGWYNGCCPSAGGATLTGGDGTSVALSSPSYGTAFLTKLSSAGTPLWVAKAYNRDVGFYNVAVDSQGNPYVVGIGTSVYSGNPTTVVNANGSTGAVSNQGTGSEFLIKFNTVGIMQWSATPVGSLDFGYYPISITTGDNVLFGGSYSSGPLTLPSTDGNNLQLAAPSGKDGFVAQYDVNGKAKWAVQIPGTNDQRVVSICGVSSNVWVGGLTTGGIGLPGISLTPRGAQNIFILQTVTNGNVLSGSLLGGTGTDTLTSLQVAGSALGLIAGNEGGNFQGWGSGITNAGPFVLTAYASLQPPPTITSQPQSVTVNTHASASFSVTASSTIPLSYQWSLNGTNISGATNSSYNLASATTNDAGTYIVIVSNAGGSVTSSNAVLTVIPPPTITTQPVNQTVNQGSPVGFSVTATGTGLGFQWRLNTVSISGATNSIYNIASATTNHAGIYSVIVSNTAGSVTSSNAVLAVIPPPTITTQPLNQTVNQGSPVSFSVVAAGTGLAYQWRLNTVSISGATNANYNIASATTNHAGTYAVIVSNAGGSVTSSNAVLTVIPPPRTGTGTATLFDVFVVAVNITDGGSGYTNPPLVRLIGGGGSGAQAVAVVSNGVITAITMRNAGYGYTSAPLVVIDPPFILNPVLDIAPMSFLTFSNLTVGGVYQLQRAVAWYWTNEPVSFTAAEVTYTEMVVGLASSGDYRLALNPVPAQAFATSQVVNGFCVGAMVTSGGSGYVTSPAVSIVGGGGTNATAVSYISGGVVTSIGITSAGIGYTNTPTVEIDQPPAAAVSPTVLPVMRVDAARLAPYNNYQIQFKPALGGPWQNWADGLFAPTDVTSSQYLFITNSAGFVRLQHVP